MNSLLTLRAKFDLVVQEYQLSEQTIERYSSWIRRYLFFCKHFGVGVGINSAKAFLQTYSTYSTQRQGYFAIKLFICDVVGHSTFIRLAECRPERKIRSSYWKKFKRRWRRRWT